jgi:hypothetical protein
MKREIVLYFMLIFISISAFNQEEKEDLKYFPAQISFVYPIGSHGPFSQKYVYNLSFNILMGRTGAVEGFEGAGILNFNDNYFNGFQGAGIGNICAGSFYGFQGAGWFNAVGKQFTGIQAAGILNVNGADSKAAQMAGIANINTGNLIGLQAAGIVNAAKTVDGAQLAGITNVAKDVKGAQIAGYVNIAENVDGLQLAGIINVCDSIDGIPFALFSYVRKNGYRSLEISTSEINPATISFKTGVKRFYTIFSIGYFNRVSDYNITASFGIGTRFFGDDRKYAVDLELRNTQITKNFITDEYLAVNSLILDYSRTFFNHIEIFGGPSFNMLVASKSLNAAKVSPPWAMALKMNNHIWGWAGFHCGLRF